MLAHSAAHNDYAARAAGLAATLQRLRLPGIADVTSTDVEWMYGFPDARPLLDAIAAELAEGNDKCVLPAGGQEKTQPALPIEYAEYVLPALPPACEDGTDARRGYRAALAEHKRAALARIEALRAQRSILQQVLAQTRRDGGDEKEVLTLQESEEFWEGVAEMRGPVTALADSVCALDEGARTASLACRVQARTIVARVEAYLAAERRVYTEASAKAAAVWARQTEKENDPTAVDHIASACATAAAEKAAAQVEYARVTGKLQALREGAGGDSGNSSGNLSIIGSQRAVQRTREDAAERQATLESLASDVAEEYVRARVGAAAATRRKLKAELRAEAAAEWVAVAGLRTARVAVAVACLQSAARCSAEVHAELSQSVAAMKELDGPAAEIEPESSAKPGHVPGVTAVLQKIAKQRRTDRRLDSEIEDLKVQYDAKVLHPCSAAQNALAARVPWAGGPDALRSHDVSARLRDARAAAREGSAALAALLVEKRDADSRAGGGQDAARWAWVHFMEAYAAESNVSTHA
jgi:hypothetical protein